jgi:alpha-galactosidase
VTVRRTPCLHAAFRVSPFGTPRVVPAPGTPAARPAAGGCIAHAGAVAIAYPHRAERFYRHGWHSFSSARWLSVAQPVAIVPIEELRLGGDDPVYALRDRHGGSAVGAVESGAEDQVLLLGALDVGGRVEWDGGELTGAFEGPAGDWFFAYGAEDDVFAHYAALLARRLGARRRTIPRTWTSWYSFSADVDEERLQGVLDGVAALPFDCFMVDDGWQRSIGDWLPSERFPSGMDGFATRTRRAGLVPGIWLAPFLAQRTAPVLREHPDWFVHDDEGRPVRAGRNWGDDYFGLDLTHPDALAFVAGTIRTVVGWGYGLLKLDFLFSGAIPGRRREDVARERAYRRGVEVIREAAGEDVLLLACGAPIVPSLGVFDSIRIGPDVAPWWENPLARHLQTLAEPGTRNAIATSVHRLWLRPLINTDPDVVYFRARYQMLLREQQRCLQDLAHVCGVRSTSDPPGWLDPAERAALERFLAQQPTVRRLGRYRFSLDGRDVDFTAIATAHPDLAPGPAA